jgi:hypothetical protein
MLDYGTETRGNFGNLEAFRRQKIESIIRDTLDQELNDSNLVERLTSRVIDSLRELFPDIEEEFESERAQKESVAVSSVAVTQTTLYPTAPDSDIIPDFSEADLHDPWIPAVPVLGDVVPAIYTTQQPSVFETPIGNERLLIGYTRTPTEAAESSIGFRSNRDSHPSLSSASARHQTSSSTDLTDDNDLQSGCPSIRNPNTGNSLIKSQLEALNKADANHHAPEMYEVQENGSSDMFDNSFLHDQPLPSTHSPLFSYDNSPISSSNVKSPSYDLTGCSWQHNTHNLTLSGTLNEFDGLGYTLTSNPNQDQEAGQREQPS